MRSPRRTAAVAATAIALGVAVPACGGDDPTESEEYQDLLAERDELAAELLTVERQVTTLEAEVEDLRERADTAREELKRVGVARDVAAAERDAALEALEAAGDGDGEGDGGRAGTDATNDRTLTSAEADDVLDEIGVVRYLLGDEALERIGTALCTAAESSVDAVELTEHVLESAGGRVASALGGDDAVRRFVALLGSKMCHDELARLGLTPA